MTESNVLEPKIRYSINPTFFSLNFSFFFDKLYFGTIHKHFELLKFNIIISLQKKAYLPSFDLSRKIKKYNSIF